MKSYRKLEKMLIEDTQLATLSLLEHMKTYDECCKNYTKFYKQHKDNKVVDELDALIMIHRNLPIREIARITKKPYHLIWRKKHRLCYQHFSTILLDPIQESCFQNIIEM